MIKIEYVEVSGWAATIRGMRNPKNSWEKSDSEYIYCEHNGEWQPKVEIGPNDHDLMTKLRNAGTDHRKYLRYIDVTCDVVAPLYWWKEFDTYKVGTVANSCSTMHKIHEKEFTLDDFSCEHLVNLVPGHEYFSYGNTLDLLKYTIEHLNFFRSKFIEMPEEGGSNGMTKKDVWWQMIQLLPSSYNQRRTIKLNYEVLANIYKSRRGHKLDEWREFCKWIESLPYSELITGIKKEGE